MINFTTIDTDAPSEALQAYWDSPEFAAYLKAKADREQAHKAYVELAGKCSKTQHEQGIHGLRVELNRTAEEARRLLAICRALPIHEKAFGW
jgi:hypothetical protein